MVGWVVATRLLVVKVDEVEEWLGEEVDWLGEELE